VPQVAAQNLKCLVSINVLTFVSSGNPDKCFAVSVNQWLECHRVHARIRLLDLCHFYEMGMRDRPFSGYRCEQILTIRSSRWLQKAHV
jgi:hypothetical protein